MYEIIYDIFGKKIIFSNFDSINCKKNVNITKTGTNTEFTKSETTINREFKDIKITIENNMIILEEK